MISADVPHNELFSKKASPEQTSDEHRHLMDDLGISKESVNLLFFYHIFFDKLT